MGPHSIPTNSVKLLLLLFCLSNTAILILSGSTLSELFNDSTDFTAAPPSLGGVM